MRQLNTNEILCVAAGRNRSSGPLNEESQEIVDFALNLVVSVLLVPFFGFKGALEALISSCKDK